MTTAKTYNISEILKFTYCTIYEDLNFMVGYASIFCFNFNKVTGELLGKSDLVTPEHSNYKIVSTFSSLRVISIFFIHLWPCMYKL